MSNFGAILTNAGAAKLANAIALGVPLKLTQMAVGDGNGQPVAPDPAMPAIPGEKRRAAINTLFADPLAASQLVAEQIIPEDVGGWWIRCVGLYDDSNTLIAIANVPDTYKPLLTSGAGRTQIIRMVLIVSDTNSVELKIDPAVVLATRKYVDEMISSRNLTSGQPLPTKNIGPIWHDDYASWMVWQEFTANGANYRGYASQLIGRLLLDTQPTPRAGYIKSGVQNLSRVTYAALRAWAMHNGLMVAPGVWAAGAIQCADNADGTTFRIYDVRSEFFRALDDGRGVDAGRVFGSSQASANLSHIHVAEYAFLRKGANPGGVNSPSSAYTRTYFDPIGEEGQLKKAANGSWGNGSVGLTDLPSGETEARPRNSALLAAIKY